MHHRVLAYDYQRHKNMIDVCRALVGLHTIQ